MNRAKGVDVSHWKPVKDWAALAGAGVTFIGMKATEGNTYTDDTLAAHVRGFRASSMLLGVYYHFARPGDPEKQADRFISVVTRTGALQPNERLALDLEGSGPTEDPREALGWIDAFFKRIHKGTGRYPLLYTSKRIWRMIGNPSWELAPQVDLWVPRYNSTKEPEMFGPWFTPPTEVEVSSHGTWEPGAAKPTKDKTGLVVTYSKGANVVTLPLAGEGSTWRRKTPLWTIWQWTDGTNPEHITPGLGRCDANWFRGDDKALKNYAAAVCK